MHGAGVDGAGGGGLVGAGDLPAGTPVVVMCHSGVRSAQGAAVLRRKGVDAHSLRGGIVAWRRAGERVTGARR